MTVYVRWYGNVVQGELLDGECLGMKQVRIPLDGHHPVALFTPGHIYDSPEQVAEKSSINPQKSAEISEKAPIIAKEEPKISPKDVLPADDRETVEAFKRDNWDHEHNHLRIDKLDEFYKLWRIAMTPFDFVEAEAPKRIVSDEKMEELKQQLKEKLDKLPEPHQAPKSVSPKPSKKMIRSTGQQQFKDSTQLALFD
jgi:hypothetical protein